MKFFTTTSASENQTTIDVGGGEGIEEKTDLECPAISN